LTVADLDFSYIDVNSSDPVQPSDLGAILDSVGSNPLTEVSAGEPGTQPRIRELYSARELNRRKVCGFVHKNTCMK
jgi:hypothetical protein